MMTPIYFSGIHSGLSFVATRQIGDGGMANVYRAANPLGEPVAIKVLKNPSREMMDRFEREWTIAETLTHPNIIRTYSHDIDRNTGCPFIVMELLEGRTLYDFLSNQPGHRLSVKKAAEICLQVCGALLYIHSQQVFHRDLHFENVFLCKEEIDVGVPRVKVMDFGLARNPEAEYRGLGRHQKLTLPHVALGTPAFVAPEQGAGKPGYASDTYALGILLYYALEGRFPFPSHLSDPIEIIGWHIQGVPEEMTACTSLPMQQFIMKMLSKKPSERPSVASVSEELLRIIRPPELRSQSANMSPTIQMPIFVMSTVEDIPTQRMPTPEPSIPVMEPDQPTVKVVTPESSAVPQATQDVSQKVYIPRDLFYPDWPPRQNRSVSGEIGSSNRRKAPRTVLEMIRSLFKK